MDIWNDIVARWTSGVDKAPAGSLAWEAPQEYRIFKFIVGFLGLVPFSWKKAVLWIRVIEIWK